MVIKKTLKKTLVSTLLPAFVLLIAACGGGSSSSSSNENDCVSLASAPGGVNATNSCDFRVTVAFFNPLFRFSLQPGETQFLARTGRIEFGVCRGSDEPKELGDGFICD